MKPALASKHPVLMGLLSAAVIALGVAGSLLLGGYPVAVYADNLSGGKALGAIGLLLLFGVGFGYAMKILVDQIIPRIPQGPLGWAITVPPSLLVLYLLLR